ncbi:tetratricopeptide repeat protein [mine drainage metagenome]|uniref:Tetratricopeptide repeat protein n=1 Tax=mine drainage metagenome TaxID=410659 RepID=A0A1J5QT43_9ZZZZ
MTMTADSPSPTQPAPLALETDQDDLRRARAALDAHQFEACVALCRDMRGQGNTHPVLDYMEGISLFQLGHREVGTAMIGRAAERQPDNLLLRIDHANSLAAVGLMPAAIQVMIEGIRRHGPHPDIAQRLALMFSDIGQHYKAQLLLVSSIAAYPARVDLCCMLAAELAAELKTNEAITLMELSHILCGDVPGIHSSLAVLHQARGDVDQAITHYRRAIDLAPDLPLPHANLSTALLLRHDYARGYQEAEWRLKSGHVRMAQVPAPRWSGEDLAGKTLLVTAEQGFGDMIQHARFLAPLRGRGGTVILECHNGLERLLAEAEGVDSTISLVTDGVFPPCDYTIPLVSLPLVLGCDRAFLEASVPYLPTPPALTARELLTPPGIRLKVGLTWASRRAHGEVYSRRMLNRRSCTLEQMAQLGEAEGVALFSLQKGDVAEQLGGTPYPITDLSPRLTDFQQTAAAIAALDLVITVDTSVAHLAGAMGKPVWILLAPGQIDYRWGEEAQSPWYRQARLYRGGQGGWAGLVRAVLADLKAAAAGTLPLQAAERAPAGLSVQE